MPTARDLYEKLAATRYGGITTLRWEQLPPNEQSYWEAVWEAASGLIGTTWNQTVPQKPQDK